MEEYFKSFSFKPLSTPVSFIHRQYNHDGTLVGQISDDWCHTLKLTMIACNTHKLQARHKLIKTEMDQIILFDIDRSCFCSVLCTCSLWELICPAKVSCMSIHVLYTGTIPVVLPTISFKIEQIETI